MAGLESELPKFAGGPGGGVLEPEGQGTSL